MGLLRLDTLVQHYFDQGLANTTKAVYKTGWSHYVHFCKAYNLHPLPVTEYHQATFAAHLSLTVSWGTIRSYLSAIRFVQIRTGLPDPTLPPSPRLPYVLKGIRKQSPQHVRLQRMPITPSLLYNIHSLWSKEAITFDRVMLWAAFCTGFFGFMRAGEFTTTSTHNLANQTYLSVADIAIDSHHNPQILTIHLRQSKTDQFSKGSHIYLGKTNTLLCPVSALLAYMAITPVTRGPLFIFRDGSALTSQKLVLHLRQAISQLGMKATGYSGHSFRIGATSTAAAAGISDSTIQLLGQWKSSAFLTYIRSSKDRANWRQSRRY